MNPIRGVLLDVDGTLVESNDAHAHAWVQALKDHGYNVPFSDVRPLIGMGGDKLLPKVCGVEADSKEGKAMDKKRASFFRSEYLPGLQPTNGAEELLIQLNARGIKMAVASSSKKAELEPLLKVCNAASYVMDSTSSDDADNSKPDPDILRAALGKLEMKPEEVVMIGDTPYDVEAARKAGMRVVGLTCGGWSSGELKADIVCKDPEDLCKRLKTIKFS